MFAHSDNHILPWLCVQISNYSCFPSFDCLSRPSSNSVFFIRGLLCVNLSSVLSFPSFWLKCLWSFRQSGTLASFYLPSSCSALPLLHFFNQFLPPAHQIISLTTIYVVNSIYLKTTLLPSTFYFVSLIPKTFIIQVCTNSTTSYNLFLNVTTFIVLILAVSIYQVVAIFHPFRRWFYPWKHFHER